MWQRADEPSIIEQTAAFTFNNLTLLDHTSTHKSSVILYCSCTCMHYTYWSTLFSKLTNPRRACTVGVIIEVVCVCVCVCVCLSVIMLTATYHIYTSQVRCHRVVYGVFKTLVMWLLLKTLCSTVLVWFSDHHCLPGFLMMWLAVDEQERQTSV